MRNTYKSIIIVAVVFTLGILAWHNFSDSGVKSNAKNTDDKSNVTLNNSNKLSEEKTIEKSSRNIVIYNTHADEEYVSGKKVTDAAALINDRLNKEGLNSKFIKCNPPKKYAKAYEASREIITNNVKDYVNAVLLDIHRDISENPKSDTKKILITLAKKSPHYESNKKFAENLLKEINKSKSVKGEITLFEQGILYFNQDLSSNSVLIELGNNKSSNSDVEECINALVSALKNVENIS